MNEKDNGRGALPENSVFALDIGTRSVIGVVGIVEDDKVNVIAIEKVEHSERAMIDGQIVDIDQVAKVTRLVKERLEEKLSSRLSYVCVAAAGRALRTEQASYEMTLPEVQLIDEEVIRQLEAGAISEAELTFNGNIEGETKRQFFLVGYTVSQYYLDDYAIATLKDHHGKKLKVDIIATFLPSEVVESLSTTMNKSGLTIASLTLEPIAAINAAIPRSLRLLNLALVDIGAGTSDIAVCREGSVTGYTMATLAGDEITEAIMKQYLVDFNTAETIKFSLEKAGEIRFTDILGFEQNVSATEVLEGIQEAVGRLCREIAEKILEINGGVPSAVFLAGGGSKLSGLREGIVECLKMDLKRVAIAGNNFRIHAVSEFYDLYNPEYATPLGIAISAGLNLISDSFRVTLNGKQAKLFRSGTLSIMDILMMNGFSYQDMIGRSGQNMVVTVDGKRTIFYGELAEPARLEVNGEPAKVSDIVAAGDNILFVPARHGAAAEATLADLRPEHAGLSAELNGEIEPWDTPLKTGDTVWIGEKLEKMSVVVEEEPQQIAPPEEIPAPKEPEPVIKPQVEEEAAPELVPPAPAAGFTVTLNRSKRSFPPKKSGEGYYLMDMLQYSEIDFNQVTGQVVLEVNGAPAPFQQVLKDGDVISIYEE